MVKLFLFVMLSVFLQRAAVTLKTAICTEDLGTEPACSKALCLKLKKILISSVSLHFLVLQVVGIQLLAAPSGILRIKLAMSALEVVPAWNCWRVTVLFSCLSKLEIGQFWGALPCF